MGSVFLALIGLFFFHERLGPLQLLGVCCAFLGVAAFTLSIHGGSIENVQLPAVLLLLSSALIWSVYAFLQRHASRDNLGSEFLMIMFAVSASLTFFLTTPSEYMHASPLALLSTLILALLTISGYGCFSKAMSTEIPLTHLTVVTCTSPLLTLLMLLFLNNYFSTLLPPEGLTPFCLIPAAFCMFGVYLVVAKKKTLPLPASTEKISVK